MEGRTNRNRRIKLALLVGAIAQFALLYAPQPVLPQLADAFTLSTGVVASLVSAATLGLAVAAIPMGALAERVGRRRTMVSALLVSEALGLVLPFVHDFPALIVLRLFQGMAVAGLAAIVGAYLAAETDGKQLGATMGLYVAGTTIGGMTGRLLGGIVGDFVDWDGALLAVAVLAGVCTLLFVALLPGREQVAVKRSTPIVTELKAALRDPVLRTLYLAAALGMGTFVTVYNVLVFRLIEPPLSVPHALAALIFLAYAAGTVSSAIAGRVADRWGRPPTLLSGLAITAAGLALMLANDLLLIVTGLVILTAGFFAAHSVASGWVSSRASAEARGQASALYQFAYYGGSSVGGILGGTAYAITGWPGMTLLLVAWLVIAAAGVIYTTRAEAVPPERLPELVES